MRVYDPIAYFRVDTSNRGDWAIQKSITEAIKERINIPFAFFSLKNDELTEERILHQINKNCSALMIAGSGVYSNYKTSSGFYFRCQSELFKKIKIPIMLIGLGNNQNLKGNLLISELSREAKKSIKLINDLSVISTVRDKRTYDLLASLGIKNHQLMLDPGNFIKVRRQRKIRRVAIQIAQHAPILGRFDCDREGMANRWKNIRNFANLSTYLIKKDYNVVFIAHDALENSLIEDLRKLVPEIEGLNTDNLNEMLEEYSSCSFTIGMKMHSCIMSFAAGTPFLNVYYDQKSIEYLKMLELPGFGINVFTDYYDILKHKVDDMIEFNDGYIELFKELKKSERILFDQVIGEVCDIIETQN